MSPTYETPEAIVAGIGNGDREAESAMIVKYGRALFYVLEKRTRDKERAQDLQQEAFIVVLQKLRKEPISDPSKLAAYLHNTAINLYIGEVRKEIRRNTVTDSETIETIADNCDDQFRDLINDRAKLAVKKIINELKNDRDRKILMAYYIDDSDKALICEDLNLSLRHFDRVISRARQRFKELVEENSEKIPLEVMA